MVVILEHFHQERTGPEARKRALEDHMNSEMWHSVEGEGWQNSLEDKWLNFRKIKPGEGKGMYKAASNHCPQILHSKGGGRGKENRSSAAGQVSLYASSPTGYRLLAVFLLSFPFYHFFPSDTHMLQLFCTSEKAARKQIKIHTHFPYLCLAISLLPSPSASCEG